MNVCLKIVRLFLPLGNALTCVYVSICISSSFLFNPLTHLLSLSLFLSLSLSSSLPQHIKKKPLPLFYSPFLSHCLCIPSPNEHIQRLESYCQAVHVLACRNFVEFKRNSTVKKAFPSNEPFSGSKWVSTTQNVRNEFLNCHVQIMNSWSLSMG